MKKPILSLLILGAAAVGVGYGLRSRTELTPTAAAPPTAQVEARPLQRGRLTQTVQAFGVIAPAPAGERSLSVAYESLVRRVHVAPGSRVVAGDVLLEVGPSADGQVLLASARSALALAEEMGAATLQRFELKLATRQEWLGAQQVEKEARLRWESLQSRGLTGDGRIEATQPGVVSRVEVSAGLVVPPGGVLVTTISARYEARIAVELADLSQVAPGQTVRIQSSNRPEHGALIATVTSIDGQVDPVTGAAMVRVALLDDSAFLMGEHVQAQIAVKQSEGWKVPRRALLPMGEQRILFTVRKGRAVRHEVRTGIEADGFVEVSGDQLQSGELVVTQGNYELAEGMAVEVAGGGK